MSIPLSSMQSTILRPLSQSNGWVPVAVSAVILGINMNSPEVENGNSGSFEFVTTDRRTQAGHLTGTVAFFSCRTASPLYKTVSRKSPDGGAVNFAGESE